VKKKNSRAIVCITHDKIDYRYSRLVYMIVMLIKIIIAMLRQTQCLTHNLHFRYMENVSSCSYREGDKLYKWDGNGTYAFPVTVQSDGGELLTSTYEKSTYDGSMVEMSVSVIEKEKESEKENEKENEEETEKVKEEKEYFDTLISINVIEHTQDAFKYLTGLYLSLRKGGLLIFHDRYYHDSAVLNGDVYHPIRIKKIILDRFLLGFKTLYNNCSAGYGGRRGEEGYYIVAVKL
jgi:Methyltransferase domain